MEFEKHAIMSGFCRSSHICDHLSENPHSSHKHAYWKKKYEILKFSCEITHATGNIYKDWWGQQSAKEASNHQKLYTILLAWLCMESSKIFVSFL